MTVVTNDVSQHLNTNWRAVVGFTLCVSGAMVLVDQFLRVQWLTLLAPITGGLIFLGAGMRSRLQGYFIAGSIAIGSGLGVFIAMTRLELEPLIERIGASVLGLALGFAAITVILYWVLRKFAWWPLIPAVTIGTVGFTLLYTRASFFDFILYVLTGLGLVLLAVGITKHWIGLIIPGCLLIGIGPGVSIAWGVGSVTNSLAQTGVMLVWFAFGWGLITLFSRVVIEKFVWWPLIPGGIIAMVGWGLYIGGNPGNAVAFIGNTGSIVMIIFGAYLLLMRRGIRR